MWVGGSAAKNKGERHQSLQNFLKSEAMDRLLESIKARWSSMSGSQKVAVVAVVAGSYVFLKKRKQKDDGPRCPQTVPGIQTKEELSTTTTTGAAYVTEKEARLLRPRSKKGMASREPTTVPALIEGLAENESAALKWEPYGATGPEVTQYLSWTWREYVAEVKKAAAAMVALGMQKRESCALLGFNSKEWLVADLGAILAGGFATGIYATNGVEAVRYILEHSRSRLCVCEGMKQAEKCQRALFQGTDAPPRFTTSIIVYGPDVVPSRDDQERAVANGTAPGGPFLTSWSDFQLLGSPKEVDVVTSQRVPSQDPGDCCTLIYTSGTTGAPKAVMISHDNITFIVSSFASQVAFDSVKKHRIVSYLPLSHIAAQAIDVYAALCTVGQQLTPDSVHCVEEATIYFARPDALKGSLRTTLCAVRPTVFFAVPRVFEKFAEALRAVGAKTTGVKKLISTWAKSVAKQKYDRLRADATDPDAGGLLGVIAEAVSGVILKKVHAAIGLDKAYFVFTGAAPIAVSTLEYFGSLGLVVNEAFGMSEVTGPSSVTLNPFYVPGTCGVACPGVAIKLEHVPGRDKPDEGEVCFRGRSVMMGYLDNPDKAKEALDDEGWLHSGDTGRLVTPKEGGPPLLKIVGRIKELLITAGGENVAPVPIEDILKTKLDGLVNDVVLVGDRLKFLSVLFTLKQAQADDGTFKDELIDGAVNVDPACKTARDAMDSPLWTATMQDAIDDYNANSAVSQAQKIQRFAILPVAFSQNSGELTPTLKLKRTVVVEKYSNVLNTIYNTNASAIWNSQTFK